MEFDKFLDKIECQFLSCYPVYNLDWEELIGHLTGDKQTDFIKKTFGHPLNVQQPISRDYQIYLLKKILKDLDDKNVEICDEFFEQISQVYNNSAGSASEKYIYRHFWLPAFDTSLTLCETKYIVYESNTGLCTWQAALALADYLLHNPKIVQSKHVIELGAGTGLLSLMALRCLEPQSMILTDGSQDSVELIHSNFEYNFKNAKKINDSNYSMQYNNVGIYQMLWNDMETDERLNNFMPDVILASDVTFDDSIFDDLMNAIQFLFNQSNNQAKLYLAATVRNEVTLNNFTKLLENSNFQIEYIKNVPVETSYLYWNRSTPVSLLLITRKQDS